jgi:uncharacterized protein YbjT (DUF2867 family)
MVKQKNTAMTYTEMSNDKIVLVAGATGGVGQLAVANLLEKGLRVRVLTRSAAKAQNMFNDKVEIVVGDIRDAATLPQAMQDITHIICAAGTTAFPSERWEFEQNPNLFEWVPIFLDPKSSIAKAKNSPDKADAQGVINLIAAAPQNLQRFVFISSAGVLRKDAFPYNILNAFGGLNAKQKGEEALVTSGLPYTIIRPGQLIDGPYTSYDLNTLIKAKTDAKLDVVLGTGDKLSGQTSRIDIAAACVESLFYSNTSGLAFEIINKGTRPPVIDWEKLFKSVDS